MTDEELLKHKHDYTRALDYLYKKCPRGKKGGETHNNMAGGSWLAPVVTEKYNGEEYYSHPEELWKALADLLLKRGTMRACIVEFTEENRWPERPKWWTDVDTGGKAVSNQVAGEMARWFIERLKKQCNTLDGWDKDGVMIVLTNGKGVHIMTDLYVSWAFFVKFRADNMDEFEAAFKDYLPAENGKGWDGHKYALRLPGTWKCSSRDHCPTCFKSDPEERKKEAELRKKKKCPDCNNLGFYEDKKTGDWTGYPGLRYSKPTPYFFELVFSAATCDLAYASTKEVRALQSYKGATTHGPPSRLIHWIKMASLRWQKKLSRAEEDGETPPAAASGKKSILKKKGDKKVLEKDTAVDITDGTTTEESRVIALFCNLLRTVPEKDGSNYDLEVESIVPLNSSDNHYWRRWSILLKRRQCRVKHEDRENADTYGGLRIHGGQINRKGNNFIFERVDKTRCRIVQNCGKHAVENPSRVKQGHTPLPLSVSFFFRDSDFSELRTVFPVAATPMGPKESQQKEAETEDTQVSEETIDDSADQNMELDPTAPDIDMDEDIPVQTEPEQSVKVEEKAVVELDDREEWLQQKRDEEKLLTQDSAELTKAQRENLRRALLIWGRRLHDMVDIYRGKLELSGIRPGYRALFLSCIRTIDAAKLKLKDHDGLPIEKLLVEKMVYSQELRDGYDGAPLLRRQDVVNERKKGKKGDKSPSATETSKSKNKFDTLFKDVHPFYCPTERTVCSLWTESFLELLVPDSVKARYFITAADGSAYVWNKDALLWDKKNGSSSFDSLWNIFRPALKDIKLHKHVFFFKSETSESNFLSYLLTKEKFFQKRLYQDLLKVNISEKNVEEFEKKLNPPYLVGLDDGTVFDCASGEIKPRTAECYLTSACKFSVHWDQGVQSMAHHFILGRTEKWWEDEKERALFIAAVTSVCPRASRVAFQCFQSEQVQFDFALTLAAIFARKSFGRAIMVYGMSGAGKSTAMKVVRCAAPKMAAMVPITTFNEDGTRFMNGSEQTTGTLDFVDKNLIWVDECKGVTLGRLFKERVGIGAVEKVRGMRENFKEGKIKANFFFLHNYIGAPRFDSTDKEMVRRIVAFHADRTYFRKNQGMPSGVREDMLETWNSRPLNERLRGDRCVEHVYSDEKATEEFNEWDGGDELDEGRRNEMGLFLVLFAMVLYRSTNNGKQKSIPYCTQTEAETKQYMSRRDNVAEFVKENFTQENDPVEQIIYREFYKQYRAWCEERRYHVRTAEEIRLDISGKELIADDDHVKLAPKRSSRDKKTPEPAPSEDKRKDAPSFSYEVKDAAARAPPQSEAKATRKTKRKLLDYTARPLSDLVSDGGKTFCGVCGDETRANGPIRFCDSCGIRFLKTADTKQKQKTKTTSKKQKK